LWNGFGEASVNAGVYLDVAQHPIAARSFGAVNPRRQRRQKKYRYEKKIAFGLDNFFRHFV
jgi:hypothetical protein